MMSPRLLIGVIATVALCVAGPLVVRGLFHGRAATLTDRIQRAEAILDTAAAEQVRHVKLKERIQAVVDQTLGGELETVDHELRSRLNRIGESVGLADLVVNTTRSAARQTPARGQLTHRAERSLRDEIDFVELEGVVSGEGSLEEALRLVHWIDTEPWLKRIDQLRLEPRDNGGRLSVTIRLTTLFLPGRVAASPPDPVVAPAGFDRYVALAHGNPFRLPPPAAPPTPTPVPAPTPPAPAFAYHEWAVTGVLEGPDGAEVWLVNQKTREARQLLVGDRLHEAVLAEATRGRAEFQRGEGRFVVRVGGRLR